MKNYTVLFIILLFFPYISYAKGAGGGTHYYNRSENYDCSLTPKPGKIKWVAGSKKDKKGDNVIILTWEDSYKAHNVEIYINGKKKKTADDAREKIKNLENGKTYSFKVRGVSNCGKGSLSKTYKAQP